MIARTLTGALICAACALIAISIVQLLYAGKARTAHARRSTIAPVASLAIVGGLIAFRGAPMPQVAFVAALGIPLAGAWYADALAETVPDVFTLLPLAIVAAFVVLRHVWWVAASGAAFFIIFGIAAFATRGRGMGWGDTKFAALAAAIIGFTSNLLVIGLACLSAVAVSVVRNRGTKPITFAPYIAAWTLVYIAFTVRGR